MLVIAGVVGIGLARYQPLVSDVLGHSSATYREGAPFSYAFELVNRGRLPVTVTSIDRPPGLGLIGIEDVLVSKTDGGFVAGDIAPRSYEPFPASSSARVRCEGSSSEARSAAARTSPVGTASSMRRSK